MAVRAAATIARVTAWWPPVVVGIAAAAASAVLLQISLIWIALVMLGLLVVAGSFLVRDFESYWLAVFLFTIPVNFTKLFFFSPEDIAALRRLYDIHQLENLVPLLYLSDLPLFVLLLLWLRRVLSRHQRLEFPKALWIMVSFLVWCLVTMWGARAPWLGLTWIFFQVKMVLVFLWFVNASLKKSTLRLAVAVMVLGLAFQGALTVYVYFAQIGGANVLANLLGLQTTQTITKGPARVAAAYVYEQGELLRGTGTVGIANNQAKYFVMLIPLAFISALFAGRRLYRLLYWLACTLGLAGLYFTYSRGGMVATLVALGILAVLIAKRGLIHKKTFTMLVVVCLLIAALASPFFIRYLTTRPGFFDTRLQHIQYGLQMALKSPLAGFGINNFNVSVSARDFEGVFSRMPIHNHYLRIVLETGLVGLALYLSFFAWILVRAYRCIYLKDIFLSTTSMALLASLVGILVYWMDDIFYVVIVRSQWWVIPAMVVVIHRLAKRDNLPVVKQELALANTR